jgi:hypothetical protein
LDALQQCSLLGERMTNALRRIKTKMAAADSPPQRVFHMFLTKKPSNPQWTLLFHHSAMSVLQFHPASILVLHVSFDGALDLVI